MRKSVNLVNGKAFYETSSVGPSHDPYHRVVITRVDRDDNHLFTLYCCGLLGLRLDASDGVVVAESFDGTPAFDTAVEKYTGFNTHFWLDKIWEYKERALYARVGEEEYYNIKEIEAIDAQMLAYAM